MQAISKEKNTCIRTNNMKANEVQIFSSLSFSLYLKKSVKQWMFTDADEIFFSLFLSSIDNKRKQYPKKN